MMTSQILRSADFTKSQKPRYLEDETSFSLQIKKLINCTSKTIAKNNFVAEVTFNVFLDATFSILINATFFLL